MAVKVEVDRTAWDVMACTLFVMVMRDLERNGDHPQVRVFRNMRPDLTPDQARIAWAERLVQRRFEERTGKRVARNAAKQVIKKAARLRRYRP